MKQAVQYALFGTVIAIAAGLIGAFGFTNTESSTMSNPLYTSGMMVGHITLTAHDSDGNIKAYRQTDNLIVDQGENCALAKMFGNNTGSGAASCLATTGFFQVIAVGNGTTVAAFADTTLEAEHPKTGNPNFGLQRAGADTIAITPANGATTTAKAVLTKQFTSTAASSVTVSESGIFNSTSTTSDALFARQVFTGIPLNNGESLTVEWTINIGGTGTLPSGTEET